MQWIGWHCVCVLVLQSRPTLCDPMDGSPPGSSVHEIFQTRLLEWVAFPFSRGSSQPRGRTQVSHISGRFFTSWAFLVESSRMTLQLLLLSRFSRVRLCATPWTAAHQAPPSLGFSRQEMEWVAISFSNAWKWKWSRSVVSDSSRPHRLQPTRLLCPWDFPGKSTGVGHHCLL